MKDCTQKNGEDNDYDDNTDYNFYYENNPDWNEQIVAGTVHIEDTSGLSLSRSLQKTNKGRTKDFTFFVQ